jgi:transposase
MSRPFDLSQFPDLPPEVVKAFAAQSAALEAARFEASVERAARQHEQAVGAEKDAFITELKALIEKLEGQVQDYRRTKFGPKSEKLDPAQLELALEDLEAAIAETQEQIAAVEAKIAASETDPEKKAPRKRRKTRALPEHLPRVERVIEPDSIACPCGCGDMVRIGEDRVDRLDYIPARYQVIVTIRPKYACPKGRAGVVQARAPAHLLEGSWPTEALLAQIAVSKHSEHMPLNRQAVVMARCADRPVGPRRLDGSDRCADRAGGGPHGGAAETGQHPALCRRDDRPCSGPRARQDEDRLFLGGAAR